MYTSIKFHKFVQIHFRCAWIEIAICFLYLVDTSAVARNAAKLRQHAPCVGRKLINLFELVPDKVV